MKYEIIETLGTFKVWRCWPSGNAEVVKIFKTLAGAQKWVARQRY